jgi:Uma2 family endonuclease
MAQFQKIPDLTVEEYLAQEQLASVRHEYVNGQLFAMTGASDAHNVICGNLFALIHQHLKGSGCRAYINDMKVRIDVANSFYYPDIMVTCEPIDAKSAYKQLPVLIVEVLSPSTSHIDRREKLVAYRHLNSLRQYLIVHQNRYRIEAYRKDKNGQWEVTVITRNDMVSFTALPCELEISTEVIYEGVALQPTVEEDNDEEKYEYEFSRR